MKQYKYDLIEGEVDSVVRLAKELVAAGWEPAFPMTVVARRHNFGLYAVQWLREEVGA